MAAGAVEMASAPPLSDTDLVTAVVKIAGETIDDAIEIQRIETIKHVGRIPYAILTLRDGSVAEENFKLSESTNFVPGAEIEILVGYHGDDSTVFKGVIVKQAAQVSRARECRLVVTCCDKAFAMTLGRKHAQFSGETETAALQGLIEAHDLTADVAVSGGEREQLVQYFASDWDYLLCRADANGALALVDDATVSVRPPAFDPPVVQFGFGASLIEIDVEMDARTQYKGANARTWDAATQALSSQTGAEPSWSGPGNLSGETLAKVFGSANELQSAGLPIGDPLKAWADAELLRSRLSRIRGRGSFAGYAALKPGQQIDLEGLGARFDGTAFVSGVRQLVEGGTWKTELTFGLPNARHFVASTPVDSLAAGGLAPATRGLQIGKVKQIQDDPASERRVKVSMPLLAEEGIWMRLASGYATAGAGFCFLPEVEDEVVVGFLNGDPAAPVVLGSLHSSARKAPYEPEATNATKAIVSNKQLKLIFDDAKKFIRAETPGGHSLVLSDEDTSITVKDTTGNQLLMNKSGVTLSSPGDITISASGSLKMTGTGGVTASSPANVDVSGQNTSVKANMTLSAQGQMMAELKSSAEVVIQGALVMIN